MMCEASNQPDRQTTIYDFFKSFFQWTNQKWGEIESNIFGPILYKENGWFWMPILKLHIVSYIELEQRGKITRGNIGLPRHIFLLWLPTYLPSRHLAQSLWLSNRPGGTVWLVGTSNFKAINVIKRVNIDSDRKWMSQLGFGTILRSFLVICLPTALLSFTKLRIRRSFWHSSQFKILFGSKLQHKSKKYVSFHFSGPIRNEGRSKATFFVPSCPKKLADFGCLSWNWISYPT